ncbi:MAG: hypothetical protein M5U28_17935 [Sandaracinaceae bacterium]|nr:hypothetical protein [Sandaracinaceae bacterium]
MNARRTLALLALFALAACGGPSGASHPESGGACGQLPRLRFNQLAMQLDLPLFWAADADEDGAIDPDEVRTLMFYRSAPAWSEGGRFTPDFERAYAAIVEASRAPAPEDARRRLVVAELSSAAPTLIETDLRELPEAHRAFAERMLGVAAMIDRLYARQVGMEALAPRLDQGDAASRSLFRRNWGAGCPRRLHGVAERLLGHRGRARAARGRLPRRAAERRERLPAPRGAPARLRAAHALHGGARGERRARGGALQPGLRGAHGPHRGGAARGGGRPGRSRGGRAARLPARGGAGLRGQPLGAGGRGVGGHERAQQPLVRARRPGRGLLGSLRAQGGLPPHARAHRSRLARLAGPPDAAPPAHGAGARGARPRVPPARRELPPAGLHRDRRERRRRPRRLRRHHRPEPAELGPGLRRGPRPHRGHDQPLHRRGQPAHPARAGREPALGRDHGGLHRRSRGGARLHHPARGHAQPRPPRTTIATRNRRTARPSAAGSPRCWRSSRPRAARSSTSTCCARRAC